MQSDFDLWQNEEVKIINDEISVVKNKVSGNLMISRTSDAQNLEILNIIKTINHPCVMKVYDCVSTGSKCISLCEYVDGVTLDEYVRANGAFAEEDAIKILSSICDGLMSLHANGIIHRDINPSNVMIKPNGDIKIIDFDITRTQKAGKSKDTTILGTVGYASPEQFGFSQTYAKADVYSCGVLLNFLLTAKLPDEQIYDGKLGLVVERCISIDKNNRYESIDKLKAAINDKRFVVDSILPLPGFRSDKVMPKIITSIYLVLLVILYVNIINEAFEGIYNGHFLYVTVNYVRRLIMLVFMFTAPYVLIGDMFHLANRLYKGNPKRGRERLRLLGIISIVIAILLSRIIMLFE